jgi:hypothetical protein
MTESFRCGDEPGLIAFLYDECSPQEREAVAAHVAGCPRCAVELGGLAGAREQLAVWAPPEAPLGFRITRDDLDTVVDARSLFGGRTADDESARADDLPGLRARWWRQPLPAWAQVAAAVVIFASGMMAGARRDGFPSAAGPSATTLQNVADLEGRLAGVERIMAAQADGTAGGPALMRQVRAEIAASEARLMRAQERQYPGPGVVTGPAPARPGSPGPLDDATMRRIRNEIRSEIAASERRQLQELDVRTIELMFDLEERHRSSNQELKMIRQDQSDLIRLVSGRR